MKNYVFVYLINIKKLLNFLFLADYKIKQGINNLY